MKSDNNQLTETKSEATDTTETPKSKVPVKPATENGPKTLLMPDAEKKPEPFPDTLTQAEAKKRLIQYGPSEPKEKKLIPSSNSLLNHKKNDVINKFETIFQSYMPGYTNYFIWIY